MLRGAVWIAAFAGSLQAAAVDAVNKLALEYEARNCSNAQWHFIPTSLKGQIQVPKE